MSNNTEKRLADIEEALCQLTAKKPSRIVPYLIPFLLGVIFGGLFVNIPAPTIPVVNQSTIEQQAASGGAAIPFPSGSPSPSLSALPLTDLMQEPSDSSLTNTSEESSPGNPQADNGQERSTRLFRLPRRLIR